MKVLTSEQVVCIINYLATFVFALGGARISLELFDRPCLGRSLTAALGSALCSHGGGLFFRDTLATVITGVTVMPSALTVASWDTWSLAALGYLWFEVCEDDERLKRFFSRKAWKILFNVIDAAGLGIFVTAGNTRSHRAYFIKNYLALLYFGWGTSVGGGIITTLLVRPYPLYTLKKKIPYYVKAGFLSALTVIFLMKGFTDTNVMLLLSFLAAVITLVEEFEAERTKVELYSISNCKRHRIIWRVRDEVLTIPIKTLLNPFKGIHLYLQTSFSQGRGNTCFMIISVQA